jgi:hypothetical protein
LSIGVDFGILVDGGGDGENILSSARLRHDTEYSRDVVAAAAEVDRPIFTRSR